VTTLPSPLLIKISLRLNRLPFVTLFTRRAEFAFLEFSPLFLYLVSEITGQAIDGDSLISAEFPPQDEARIELPRLV
jgi:hypothetical protein